jgi:hypothetical protein
MTIPEQPADLPPLFKVGTRFVCPHCSRVLPRAEITVCGRCGPVEALCLEFRQWIGGSRPAQRWQNRRG